jgi:uncharacterized protein YmfQ (DUF2313 family)
MVVPSSRKPYFIHHAGGGGIAVTVSRSDPLRICMPRQTANPRQPYAFYSTSTVSNSANVARKFGSIGQVVQPVDQAIEPSSGNSDSGWPQ